MEHSLLTTSRSKRKVVAKDHVNEALTQYLHSLNMINKDEEVTSFYKVPEGLDVKVEKID